MKPIEEILKEVEEYENGRWSFPHSFNPTKIILELVEEVKELESERSKFKDILEAVYEHRSGRILTRDIGACRQCDGVTSSGALHTCTKCMEIIYDATLEALRDQKTKG